MNLSVHASNPLDCARLIVLTDISSLMPGVREPDDGQSMVRLMLYSNEIEIEALIASSNMGHGACTRPELIEEVVHAYGKVQPNLRYHDADYPEAFDLLGKIHAGQAQAGPNVALMDCVGPGKDSAASQAIIRIVDSDDPRPVWIAVWGGTTDLAQCLWRTRQERSESELRAFVSKIRVHSIGDQDSTGGWIKQEFPNLFYMTRTFGYRGMYRGGDISLCSSEWVMRNVRGHGALGDLYPDYNGGDIWSSKLEKVQGMKEGDTPSYLGLIRNGLNPYHDPTWGDWGGRCQTGAVPWRFEDAVDRMPAIEDDPAPAMAGVYRWREAFQADFQARLDWCILRPKEVNHAPIARIQPLNQVDLVSGEEVCFDGSQSIDPDGDELEYRWWIYPENEKFSMNSILIGRRDEPRVCMRAPMVQQPTELPVLLEVCDRGSPRLRGYARIIVPIHPGR